MSTRQSTNPPSFRPGRTITDLVVPVTPGSLQDREVPLVALLAEAWGLPVRLVHVTPSISSVDPELEAMRDDLRSWYPGIEVQAEHLTGDDPAVAIADAVGPRALLIMSTDHIDAWAVKGSVAERVADRIGLPILLLGPQVTKQDLRRRGLGGEIVVGVDESDRTDAITAAVALAEALADRRTWLTTIVPEPDRDPQPEPGLSRHLQALAEHHSGQVETRWEIIQSNDVVGALEGFADRRDAGFLVAATRRRVDRSRQTMASIGAGLASSARRPVLLVPAADPSDADPAGGRPG